MKEKILKTASKEFAKYGYKGVSLDKVAAKIGVTKPTIYYYFKNKQALYEAVLEEKMDNLIANLKYCNLSDTEEALKCYIKTFDEVFEKYPCFASILARELISGGENVGESIVRKFAEILKILAAILKTGKEEGKFEFDSPFAVQMMIVSPLLIEKSTESLRSKISNFAKIEDVEDFASLLTKKVLKAIRK